jgi:membrane protein
VTFASIRRVIAKTCRDAIKNQTVQAAAALSYYSILCVFPALILLSAVVAYIPLPNFFEAVLVGMGRVVPPGTMPVIYGVLNDILGKNSGAWLSLGTLGAIWVVSAAFDEMIEALDAAYGVIDRRPFWKTRLLAVGLAAVTGFFLTCAIATMVVGPMMGRWLAQRFSLSSTFVSVSIWPIIHWTIAVSFTVVAVATIYISCPEHQATIPCDHAGRISLHRLLDGTLLFARDLFSILREL